MNDPYDQWAGYGGAAAFPDGSAGHWTERAAVGRPEPAGWADQRSQGDTAPAYAAHPHAAHPAYASPTGRTGWPDSGRVVAGDPVRVTWPPREEERPLAEPRHPPRVPVPPAAGAPAAGPPAGRRPVRERPVRVTGRRRPMRRFVVVLCAALLATPLSTYAWAVTALNRDVDLAATGGQHPSGEGTNYLIVGSDSRDGLTEQDRKDLHTGTAGGRRTDSMILLHTGAHGTTMMSLPRDSWVTVPGFTSPRTGKRHGPTKNKLNATYAMGGPKMLVRTVEHNTGLRVDHYAEIGFAGFVNLVDAVGGVRLCLERAVRDEKSGADLRKGCQTLGGGEALAYVRQRHQEAEGDLGRSRNQQRFLAALAHRAAAPGTVLDPSALYPALKAGLDTLVVDDETDLRDLTAMFRAVQSVTGGSGTQINVPTGRGIMTPKGSAVTWDRARSQQLFDDLKHDRPLTRGGEGS